VQRKSGKAVPQASVASVANSSTDITAQQVTALEATVAELQQKLETVEAERDQEQQKRNYLELERVWSMGVGVRCSSLTEPCTQQLTGSTALADTGPALPAE
jgi:hypothetical protein